MTLPTVCPPGGCKAIDRPLVDSSATVYVIFGLKSIDRSKITREHVIEKKVNLDSKINVHIQFLSAAVGSLVTDINYYSQGFNFKFPLLNSKIIIIYRFSQG